MTPEAKEILREHLQRFFDAIDGDADDAEIDRQAAELDRLSPDPDIIDYIFHATPEMSVDEIVEKIAAFRPIILDYRPLDG